MSKFLFQALNDIICRCWSGSHEKSVGVFTAKPGKGGYLRLNRADVARLAEKCPMTDVPVEAGAVFLFQGGQLVHGSPPVAIGEPPRWATYASFQAS